MARQLHSDGTCALFDLAGHRVANCRPCDAAIVDAVVLDPDFDFGLSGLLVLFRNPRKLRGLVILEGGSVPLEMVPHEGNPFSATNPAWASP